uniref:Uncharacterized protein n=1 Tax=Arundo donax TaxID=35708 RepID=A0A0A9G6S8_ARUDO
MPKHLPHDASPKSANP